MRIVIIEDELPNSRMLQGMLNRIRPEWEVVAVLESVQESVNYFKNNALPDLIFMDIQLADGVSFSIFEQVQINSMVIFTTAYNEYALHAFKVNSVDYLLKPVKEEELVKGIEKFERAYNAIVNTQPAVPDYSQLLDLIKSGEKKYKSRFLVSGVQDYFKIDTKDIAYFHTESRVTSLVTFEGKEHVLDVTMEKLEEQLDPNMFFRANRSHIIHIDAVKKFENYFGGKLIVKLVSPFSEKVEISRLKASDFKKWIDG